jgi:glycosyltransferase involved in cell wall biosynthesis
MRIAIDARMIRQGSMHGIARYVYELLRGIASSDSKHSYFLIVSDKTPLAYEEWPENFSFILAKSNWISFREQIEIPRLLRDFQIDLFHSPSFVAPILCHCRMIMTIHDLNHIVLPQFYTPFHQIYYRLFVKRCIQKSHAIITVSQFSKSEIIKIINLDPEKIFVTYNGVNPVYQPVIDKEQLDYVREMYELPDEFVLCVSSNKPHKNVHQLVKAYCHSSVDIPLVLATPVDPELLKLAEKHNKKHLVYFSKFIAEDHLPAIYSMTKLFIYPSTYEGFGLPPLEAMSCGAPVVVARSSALPEVVGEHAIFADPYDHMDIARTLETGVNDLALRAKMQVGVDKHRQRFSWSKMCDQTLDLYDRCLIGFEARIKKSAAEVRI